MQYEKCRVPACNTKESSLLFMPSSPTDLATPSEDEPNAARSGGGGNAAGSEDVIGERAGGGGPVPVGERHAVPAARCPSAVAGAEAYDAAYCPSTSRPPSRSMTPPQAIRVYGSASAGLVMDEMSAGARRLRSGESEASASTTSATERSSNAARTSGSASLSEERTRTTQEQSSPSVSTEPNLLNGFHGGLTHAHNLFDEMSSKQQN